MRLYLPRLRTRTLLDALTRLWTHEEDGRMKLIAFRYQERARMNGDVIKKTGEIIPKESA